MKLLHNLGDKARQVGRGAAGIFDAGALRESSIGLIRGNWFMYHACVGHVFRCFTCLPMVRGLRKSDALS
jgi:hypothetical protein